jgi:cell division protein FtsB
LIVTLIAILSYLQYRIWVGEGSLAHAHRLQQEIKIQQLENDRLKERNRILDVEVDELKTGLDTIEERARNDIGLIKRDETFFILLDQNTPSP